MCVCIRAHTHVFTIIVGGIGGVHERAEGHRVPLIWALI